MKTEGKVLTREQNEVYVAAVRDCLEAIRSYFVGIYDKDAFIHYTAIVKELGLLIEGREDEPHPASK